MKLEDLLKDTPAKPVFISPGVYTREPTSDGVRFNAPTGTSEATTLAYTYEQESDDIDRMVKSSRTIYDEVRELEIPDYLVNDPEVVGYPDLEMQSHIYNWVCQSIPWNGYTIKDLGAGRGDLYGHLRQERESVIPNYTGFEKKESLVLAGKSKYKDITLLKDDFFNSPIVTDYTVCVGTLNEDHGEDKWGYFNKTLNHAISTTKVAIIFILAADMDGNIGFLDYPLAEILSYIPKDVRFTIDYTQLEDIYKLTVHIGGYND
tara:strand:+ start:1262 stop:2047 length:786 start_codon:yes stop_codon:yes gene_type:complete